MVAKIHNAAMTIPRTPNARHGWRVCLALSTAAVPVYLVELLRPGSVGRFGPLALLALPFLALALFKVENDRWSAVVEAGILSGSALLLAWNVPGHLPLVGALLVTAIILLSRE